MGEENDKFQRLGGRFWPFFSKKTCNFFYPFWMLLKCYKNITSVEFSVLLIRSPAHPSVHHLDAYDYNYIQHTAAERKPPFYKCLKLWSSVVNPSSQLLTFLDEVLLSLFRLLQTHRLKQSSCFKVLSRYNHVYEPLCLALK